jgi:hypothetical protein
MGKNIGTNGEMAIGGKVKTWQKWRGGEGREDWAETRDSQEDFHGAIHKQRRRKERRRREVNSKFAVRK